MLFRSRTIEIDKTDLASAEGKEGEESASINMSDGKKFQVPDWKSYRTEGIPELEKTERLLAARQLKDPWIRNEVWRYTKANYGGQWRNAALSLGLGLKWAVLAMTVTIAYDVLIATEPRKDPYALRRQEHENDDK